MNEISGTQVNDTTIVYHNFFSENNYIDWEKKLCTVYGTSIVSNKKEIKYYTIWKTVSNNTITVQKQCQHSK